MLVQEVMTDLSPREVLERAREFFLTRFSPYMGAAEEQSDGHIKFTNEAAEIVIGALEHEGRTLVRGSTSRMHHEVSQFLVTLAPPEDVRQNLVGPGVTGAG